MKNGNSLIILILIILIFAEFSIPQSNNFERRYIDREKTIGYDETFLGNQTLMQPTDLDNYILSKMNQYHIPGLAACIVKQGEVYWTGTYGYANIEDSVNVTDSTLFILASVSKTITGVALMQLWEEGFFQLDEDINNYLPFEVHNPFYPDSIITFRMLLTHTSSINDNWDEMPYYAGDSPIPLGDYLENYLVPGGAYYHTINYNNFAPGTQWDYCNIAIALVGYLVEVLAGNFATYTQDSIFIALEMNETAWFLSELDTTHIARPYNYSGGNYYPIAHFGYSDYPSGQLRTSTLQLSIFLMAFMEGGEFNGVRILDSATVSLMTTVQNPQIDPYQGLIWDCMTLNGRFMWGHHGDEQGAGTTMFFSPAENVGVIFFRNMFTQGSTFRNSILDTLFNYATIVSVEAETNFPHHYRVFQNFPNPFNPNTKIKYSIPQLSNVIIKVFDIIGNEIETLVSEEKPAGTYEITWYPENLPSGVYFYQLKAGSFVETKKMVLMK